MGLSRARPVPPSLAKQLEAALLGLGASEGRCVVLSGLEHIEDAREDGRGPDPL